MRDSEMLHDLLEVTREATGADLVELTLLHSDQSIETVSRATKSGQEFGDLGLDQRAAHHRLFAADASKSPCDQSTWVQSLITVPITGPSAEAGWLAAARTNPDPFDANDDRVLGLTAHLVEDRFDRSTEQLRLNDVSDQLRRSQASLEETRQRLELSNQELEQFAYIAAHELVAPLRSVAVYAEVLDSIADDTSGASHAQRTECVSEIRLGLQRMTQQVQYLLELSRSRNESEPAALQPVSLNAVVQTAIDSLAAPIDTAAAEIVVGELPIVTAALVPLQSVFANLLSNAIRYRSEDRPLKIAVEADAAARAPRILIRDNGQGIADIEHRRIFRLFERASTTEAGSGIGLALSRRILEALDATIGVQQNPEGGSIFWIQFADLEAQEPNRTGTLL